jgi:hypothetical protein
MRKLGHLLVDVSGDFRVVNMSNLFLIESCCSGAYFELSIRKTGLIWLCFAIHPIPPEY